MLDRRIFQPTILSERGLGITSVASALALATANGLHSPRSTDSSNSFSSASIIIIVGLLTHVLRCGLPTRNDRLHENRLTVLDKRHEVHVVLASDDEDALAGITVGVWMLQDVEQVTTLGPTYLLSVG